MQNRVSTGAYFSEDTIAAIVTALGGAICVVRISGPKSFAILKSLSDTKAAAGSEARKFHRIALHDLSGTSIDDALFVRFVSPESYTGEDVVEFHLHGGSYIALKLMETLAEAGARQALPGEFSFRAVKNGKLSLSQAQAVADLIAASSDGAITLALEKLEGSQVRLIVGLAEDLRQIVMLSEASIDFSDQDLEEFGLPSLKARLLPVLEALRLLESSYDRGVRVQDGVKVAFVGLPNAGKSSFFNALLGEERSIVASQAGTTRDIIREHLSLRGNHGKVTLRLEDTAGLRYSTDDVESQGIERSRRASQDADLVILIVDSSSFIADPKHSFAAVQEQWAVLGAPKQKTLGILSKTDLIDPETVLVCQNHLQTLGLGPWILTSAKDHRGIHESVQAITGFCENWLTRAKGEVLLTRLDQKEAVSLSLDHIKRAMAASEVALFASDLRQALHALALLIGETVPDDILNRIFSQFCIGK
ncbi:MAG: tRNA uridine-5-carboxymethylaminomethyl(34) synthesis GTPase MnmE [Bdellovibrionales bacterium GWB1_52_6]|nr:MAG: tRNA uridine-5-carboxymethylaminomethyl(34) synthesis GTPase MnmE [Bdellovibrionales bacterium GWB1_52_6]OFZ04420.1 MAG: tRNA uridine-5-carboxymethylaminomethyl(34) synthesis GTPase MnmE [Bdellovibrionales bacterium GWA1_52_35]